jgi:hypothetical protein
MPKPKNAQDLARQIEDLIADFLAGHRAAASAAVQRAFASAPSVGRPRTSRKTPVEVAPRRAPDELTALSDRLYAAICAKPGEAMMVLAPAVGATPRALSLPANRLKRAGRIRTVGERQATRYFPMPKSGARSG